MPLQDRALCFQDNDPFTKTGTQTIDLYLQTPISTQLPASSLDLVATSMGFIPFPYCARSCFNSQVVW